MGNPRDTRLDHVDGLRAVAILWVAIYHYAYFWTPAGKGSNLMPYADALAWIPLANVGYLGVYLFFIVSGFVITMSLTRSATITRFGTNRLIRLWPTLLICGTLTFGLTLAFGPEDLLRSPLEYLISLTFVPPPHVGRLIGVPGLEWLDGAYWSLWTEVRFYIVAAFLYFSVRSNFVGLWTVFALACSGVHVMGLIHGGGYDAVSRLLFAQYQPYFTAGIALASLRAVPGHTGYQVLLMAAVGQAFVYPWMAQGGLSFAQVVGLLAVFALGIPTMLSRGPVPILSSQVMVTLGVASYAYYLLHQNAGMAVLHALQTGNTAIDIVIMLAVQAALVALSIVMTQYLEKPLRQFLRKRLTPRAV